MYVCMYVCLHRKKSLSLQVGAVNCEDEANAELCAKEGVQSYPTIKFVKAGGRGLSLPANLSRNPSHCTGVPRS